MTTAFSTVAADLSCSLDNSSYIYEKEMLVSIHKFCLNTYIYCLLIGPNSIAKIQDNNMTCWSTIILESNVESLLESDFSQQTFYFWIRQ